MATYNNVTTKHATLTGTTVDTLTFAHETYDVTITNEHATEILSVTLGRCGVTAATPTARGDGTYVVRGNTTQTIAFGRISSVKVLGNGNVYSVET